MSAKYTSRLIPGAALLGCLLLPLLAPLAAQSQPVPKTKPAPDAHVKASLEQLGIKYEVDEDGDYKVELAIEGERTQLCYVLSETGSWSSLTFREIWSPVYLFKGTLPAELSERLLRDSGERLVGGWCVTDWDEDQKCLYFTAKVAPDLSHKSLHEIMSVVSVVADKFEKELTQGKDEF